MKIFATASASFALLFAATMAAEAQAPAAPAPAAQEQPQAKPKPRRAAAAKNAASVTITNARTEPLQELQISTADNPPVVVATLGKPLAPGKSAKISIKGKKGCVFDVRGAFADESVVESDGHDLCKDTKLRLSE
ncbi:MAG: hypothetical protein BGP06_09935 [Rhizobiales bacterium 65-9]|nr:hypothetical protein [Hyphomicrobiales bacterium]OJY33213.1 MAG: hypothetical protein BGP06_09935 [Rhizobiales bacterium 65-9]